MQRVDPGLPDAVTAGMRPPGAARPASPRSQEHSIEHYLAHPEVATVIADHLSQGA